MSYNPAQLTPIDVIRGMGGDTSNEPTSELMVDAEYAAILGRFGVGSTAGTDITTAAFHRASAEAMRSLAVRIEQQPTSLGSPTDGSIGWSNRTSSLREQARALDATADQFDAETADGFWGPTVTVRSAFLTGTVTGGAEW
jgi:hypothetical protein